MFNIYMFTVIHQDLICHFIKPKLVIRQMLRRIRVCDKQNEVYVRALFLAHSL